MKEFFLVNKKNIHIIQGKNVNINMNCIKKKKNKREKKTKTRKGINAVKKIEQFILTNNALHSSSKKNYKNPLNL